MLLHLFIVVHKKSDFEAVLREKLRQMILFAFKLIIIIAFTCKYCLFLNI